VRHKLRTEGVVLVPALAVVALFVYWAAQGGGYAPTTWEPSALVVLGLLAATVFGLGFDRISLPRASAVALGALAVYVAWSYLSIAWAAAPGDALAGSNRTLLYGLLFALFAVLPWRTWSAGVTLTAFALGIGAIAVVTLAKAGAGGATASGVFLDARLDSPLGYPNASAALFLIGTVTSLGLAAQRSVPPWARALLLAGATATLQVAVLCESRGWLFSLPIVLVLALIAIPGRVRFALSSLLPAAGAIVALPSLLDVFHRADAARTAAAGRAELVDAAGHAVPIALVACAVVLVAGFLLALADRRLIVPSRVGTSANRVAAGLAVLAVLGGVAAGLAATHGRPDQKIANYWDRSNGYHPGDPGSSRFGLAGSNRPDFWRVALAAWADHPIGGLGQDNWSATYLRERHSGEQPRWTHSIELRLLAHTGIVGFALFAAALAAALVAATRGRRRRDRVSGAFAAAGLLPLIVWLVHGSVDWLWEFPALSGPAFAFLALGGPLLRQPAGDAETAAPPARAARPAARIAALAAGVALLLAAAVLALPYLSQRDVAAAARDWQADPAGALAQLDRAAELDPLSSDPGQFGGVIALELDRPDDARRRFGDAIARDDGNWFAYFGRALAETALHQRTAARADLMRARALDPGEPLVRAALDRVDGRRPLTAAEAFRSLRGDFERLTGS
jgi:hypothetical protein